MLPGPVFTFELLTLARRGRYYLLRALYGFALLFFIWLNNPQISGGYAMSPSGEMSIAEMSRLGTSLFVTFAFTQGAVILLLTPAMVAGSIADERQRKTLHYLLSSRLTSPEIVLGKLGARSLNVGVLVALGLPIVVILSLFGGVDPNLVLLYFGASLTTTYFLAAISILVSTYSKRPRDAVSTVYLIEILWLILPPIVLGLFPALGGGWLVAYEWMRPVLEWVGPTSPAYMLANVNAIFRGSGWYFIESVFWMMGLQVAQGSFFVLWSVLRLRPLFRKEGGKANPVMTLMSRRARRLLPRPACGEDAMRWKELYVARSSPLMKIVGGFFLVVLVGLMIYGTLEIGDGAWEEVRANGYFGDNPYGGSARERLNGWLRFATGLFGALMLIGASASAATSLTIEREEDTWVSLISTPLTALEILRAKMLGAAVAIAPLWLIWGAFLLTGLILGAIHPLGLIGHVLANVVFVAFGICLGTRLSLYSRTSARALTATIGTLIFLNGGYLILLAPFSFSGIEHLLGVTPLINGVSLLSYREVYSVTNSGMQYFGRDRTVQMLITAVLSVFLHAVSAALLAWSALYYFDDAFDRPRSQGPPSPWLVKPKVDPLVELVEG